jgi:hypothetical protein
MHIANKSQVDVMDGRLVAEASTLGLKPGEWPDLISVVNDNNEGFLFAKSAPILHDGELGGYHYSDWMSGVNMTVLND